jgi:hypothetical protein
MRTRARYRALRPVPSGASQQQSRAPHVTDLASPAFFAAVDIMSHVLGCDPEAILASRALCYRAEAWARLIRDRCEGSLSYGL